MIISGCTYDVSNKHRLGYSEVELVQKMIDGVNTLWKEDLELQKKHGLYVCTLCSPTWNQKEGQGLVPCRLFCACS